MERRRDLGPAEVVRRTWRATSTNPRRKVAGQSPLRSFPSSRGRWGRVARQFTQVRSSGEIKQVNFNDGFVSADGQYYDATIEEINTDGEVSVKFRGYKERVVSSLGLLKLPSSGTTTVHATGSAKNKKELLQHQKELKKEKKKKHLENMKTLEEEREKEKQKWSNFSAKAFGKKGFVKKSIFKTPESSDGRVGVGTCGISGQKMTEFESAKKYRKGH